VAWPSERSRDGGIDEVPLPTALPGRLFLCGKHAIGPDHLALMDRVDATTVVCLNEMHELDDRYPEYTKWLRANLGTHAVHHPIPDMHAPTVDDLRGLIDDIHERLAAGEVVIVHCAGGIGRSGTVAVAVLLRAGVQIEDALITVRSNRPMAGPEVGAQQDVLREFAQGQRHGHGD
jgi:protein-tyrosine phosphatase